MNFLQTKQFRFGVLCLIIIVILSSCGVRRMNFDRSSVEPAAKGKVKVKQDNNKNYVIDIDVRNLAPADHLPDPRHDYVVWMESSNGLQNLGQLRPKQRMLSKNIKGDLTTTSPYKPQRIFITAEDFATTSTPSSYLILTTR